MADPMEPAVPEVDDEDVQLIAKALMQAGWGIPVYSQFQTQDGLVLGDSLKLRAILIGLLRAKQPPPVLEFTTGSVQEALPEMLALHVLKEAVIACGADHTFQTDHDVMPLPELGGATMYATGKKHFKFKIELQDGAITTFVNAIRTSSGVL